MPRLNEWLTFRKDYFVLLLSVVTSLSLLFSSDSNQLQTVKAWTFESFGYALNSASALKKLTANAEENHRLRTRNAGLMLENSRLKEAALENIRLRQLLDFKLESSYRLIAAQVTGKAQNGFINSVILSAGTLENVDKNMAVVTADGLVGKIFDASNRVSTAQLVFDRNFRVSAMVQRSRVKGIVRWLEGNKLMLANVPVRSDVKEGDGIVTSGLSEIFPGGLQIGTVSALSEDKLGMFMNIEVVPAVDFGRLEEVFVIQHEQVASVKE